MSNTLTTIYNLLAYEKYLPVLTPSEVEGLLASRPTLAQLQDWERRLNNSRARLNAAFARAYQKQNMRYGK